MQEVQKQLDILLGDDAPEEPKAKPKSVATTDEFKFLKDPDENGMPQEHPSYADRKCRTCNGTGMKRLVVVDHTIGRVFDDEKKRVVKNPLREIVTCDCVNRGYVKLRKRIQNLVDDDLAWVTGSDEEKEAAKKRLWAQQLRFFKLSDGQ